jgi:thiol-disulfide isomerase/thioredoxin
MLHISGGVPIIENSYATIFFDRNGKSMERRTALNQGRFNFYIDSLKAGVYEVLITWPWPSEKKVRIYRNEMGDVITQKTNSVKDITFHKKLYINPEQSLNYHIKPENIITDSMITSFDAIDYKRTDLYRLQVISDAEDTQLFEKLDSAKRYFRDMAYYIILDSLYRNSMIPDKIHDDFSKDASQLNFKNNYAAHLQSRREIIGNYLDNPIAVLDILDVGQDQFRAEAKEYEDIYNKIIGRAKDSPYYRLLELKLNGISYSLKEGELFPMPEGKTPDLKRLEFNPSDYQYTLIEFWASWCGPCRVNNPEWNEILGAYKEKGFQILGVSIDSGLENWKKAIVNDKLDDWLHISDLGSGFTGANALKYAIEAIPFNILINSEGRIVKKNIDPAELATILTKI